MADVESEVVDQGWSKNVRGAGGDGVYICNGAAIGGGSIKIERSVLRAVRGCIIAADKEVEFRYGAVVETNAGSVKRRGIGESGKELTGVLTGNVLAG